MDCSAVFSSKWTVPCFSTEYECQLLTKYDFHIFIDYFLHWSVYYLATKTPVLISTNKFLIPDKTSLFNLGTWTFIFHMNFKISLPSSPKIKNIVGIWLEMHWFYKSILIGLTMENWYFYGIESFWASI